ncbi:MAG: DUF4185 domain-containing protein [Spirochaetes bacterium]|nr:MAG: DUF4185 domain-containing protein [Spirochaetota bacterium]
MKKGFIVPALLGLCIWLVPACGPRAEMMGPFGESRRALVLGQDGVTSIPFNNYITMWTFGDTLLGDWKGSVSSAATFSERANVRSMISNSLAFTPAPTPETIAALPFTFYTDRGEVAQFIKLLPHERPETDRLWAVDGVRMGDKVYVYYLAIRVGSSGKPFDFSMRAVGLACWVVPEQWRIGDPISFVRLPDLFPGDYPAFGVSVLEKDGYLYTAGHYTAPDLSSPVKIARVRPENIGNPGAYEFLGRGGAWTGAVREGVPLLGDVMGECSLSWNESAGEYVMVYCQLWTGRIVLVRFADFAGAEKARKEVVYEPPRLTVTGPELAGYYYSGKEVYAAGAQIFAIFIHPLEYQPYLLKITL